MERQIIQTADGSSTIYMPELNEYYHSSHGALQEAQHVFIKHGLYSQISDYLTVLEMGFGTGLNALLSYFASEKRNQYIHYIGIEAFPPTQEELEAMNYSSFSGTQEEEAIEIYKRMHNSTWNQPVELAEHFVLEKKNIDFRALQLEPGSVDLIFYDAFGPRVAPELWTVECFQLAYDMLAQNGILVTYCAKGQVKRDLTSVGFLVEALPGPPGKREMTRARKK